MVVIEFNIIRIKYGFDAKKSSQINAPKVFVVKCKRFRWFICRIKQYANFVYVLFFSDRKLTGIMNIYFEFSRATVQLISFGWNEARVNKDIIFQTLAQVSSFFNF